MGTLDNLLLGFQVATTPTNLFFCFIGTFIGTLVGVLPGIGPLAAISILLPSTYYLPPETGIIMLAGVYFGTMYGGSTTSILVNLPGEAASVVTCLDGYQMARQGRAGPALGISAIGSFVAGTFGIIVLTLVAKPLAEIALSVGPPEYFSIILTGLILLVYLAQGSMVKALIMASIGVFLGTVGTDDYTGQSRFAFGTLYLRNGIDILPVIMGLFGVTEILSNIQEKAEIDIIRTKIRQLFPSLDDLKKSAGAIVRGSILGFLLGLFPGGGGVISSFASYTVEKRLSKHPERFGKGAIEGVAGPESANNSCVSASFIPLLTMGIPCTAAMAVILGALMIHGLRPGPLLFEKNPNVFWGIIASMYVGNVMLIILNLPLVGLWVQVLRVPNRILSPIILALCIVGVYSANNNVLDIYLMVFFGIAGLLLRKFGFEIPPLIMAFILGPIFEDSFRQSLVMFRGNILGLFHRPVCLVFLGIACFLIMSAIFSTIRKRGRVLSEEALLK
jgi:putative tricarboxylic transport membrane protein